MSLLGGAVPLVAVALVLMAVAGGAWLTSRPTRRRAWALLRNAAVIVLAVLVCTASVFLVVNRLNSWYATTSDLQAAVHSLVAGPAEPSAAETHRPAAPAPGAGPFAHDPAVKRIDVRELPALPAPGQRVQTFSVPTADGAASWPITVVLPDGYFDAANAHTAYPVLMAGHGMPGTMDQYLSVADIRTYADRAVAAHDVAPFVTVIPSLTPFGQDTECMAGPGGVTQLETWLSRDVPAFVKERLRVQQARTGWAWTGVSAGAWCGVMVTMRHPDAFAAASLLSGYFRPLWDTPAGASPPVPEGYDLVTLAASSPPPVALWIQVSRRDAEVWRDNEAFLAAVRAPTLVTSVIEPAGGHAWTTWLPHMPGLLAWLGATVPGFAPQ